MTDLAAVVGERLHLVRERIRAAGGESVAIVGVTKGFGRDAVDAAAAAGADAIGESYAQELVAKLGGEPAGIEVQFIGRVQRNKVRLVESVVTVWGSVDRAAVVSEIGRRAPGARIRIQVDATGEPGKGGCRPDEVGELCAAAADAGLVVEGLMTVGPTQGGPESARSAFRLVRNLTSELGLRVCSMGMSADLEVAVEEGSTEVRIGTALFGRRSPLAVER